MGDSFLEQAYANQPYSSGRQYPEFPSTKQTLPPSMPSHSNSKKWSPLKSIKQKCTPLSQACAWGIFLGALVCSVALATILTVWLTSSSTNNASSNVSLTTTVASTVVVASTIPMTAATTTICSVSVMSSTTAAPNTTTLYTMINPCSSVSTYFPVVYYYIANGSNATITFAILNNPAATYIDNVSVVSNGVQLLCNGDFENGTQICWQGANHLSSGCGIGGSYCYSDPVTGSPDDVYQTFSTTPGALLNISFWTSWSGSGSGITTIVTITP